jgi:hypothetical protein
MRGILHSFCNLGTRWGWVVNATPRPLNNREETCIHFTGGCMGPRTDLDWCGKLRYYWDSIPGPSNQPVASRYTDYVIPAHETTYIRKHINTINTDFTFVREECRPAAACPLRLWVRVPPGAWMSGGCERCVLRRVDQSSRGVLPNAVPRFV